MFSSFFFLLYFCFVLFGRVEKRTPCRHRLEGFGLVFKGNLNYFTNLKLNFNNFYLTLPPQPLKQIEMGRALPADWAGITLAITSTRGDASKAHYMGAGRHFCLGVHATAVTLPLGRAPSRPSFAHTRFFGHFLGRFFAHRRIFEHFFIRCSAVVCSF